MVRSGCYELTWWSDAWNQVGPPKPPSPVPEGVEEEASPAKSAYQAGDAPSASQRGDSGSRERERSLEAQLLKVPSR